MITVTIEHTVAAPVEQIYEWLVNAENYRRRL
jgi:hypothetical protein